MCKTISYANANLFLIGGVLPFMSKTISQIKTDFTRSIQKFQQSLKKQVIPEQIKHISEVLVRLGEFLEKSLSDSKKVSDRITVLEKSIEKIEKQL